MSDLQTEKENNKSKGQLSLEAIIYDNRAADEIKQLYIEHHGNKRQSRKTTLPGWRYDLKAGQTQKGAHCGNQRNMEEGTLYPKIEEGYIQRWMLGAAQIDRDGMRVKFWKVIVLKHSG